MGMQMEMSYVVAVVITGLVVVFLGLILLIAFISIIGAIFKKLSQKGSTPAKTAAPAAKPVPKAVSQPAPAVTAASSGTDDDEIIAVISAAVAMMSAADGKNYRVRSVRAASSKGSAGNAWASAGLRESTNPF